MKNFMVITHTDLDGLGAAVIAKTVFNKQHVDLKFCGYYNINETVIKVLTNSNKYSHIFITDISVNNDVATIINNMYKDKVTLIDHHSNLEYLNWYDWAIVKPGIEGERDRPSGTSLFYEFLKEKIKFTPNQAMENFVEKVRRYDTWDWDYYNDEDAKKLNDYFGKIGFSDFIKEYTTKLLNNDPKLFSENAEKILKMTKKNVDNLIKTKEKQMITKEIDGYKVGYIFSEIYQSEIANELLKKHKDIDAIVLYDLSKNKLSIRSTDNSDFDCSVMCKKWFGNGGGRKNTGGAQIPEETMKQIQEILFNKLL